MTEPTAAQKTATYIKDRNGRGSGKVYRVDPPMAVHDWDDNGNEMQRATEYVWVSAADVPYSGPETYIFACDASGEVTDWGELEGSYRGGLSHEAALRNAGYEVRS